MSLTMNLARRLIAMPALAAYLGHWLCSGTTWATPPQYVVYTGIGGSPVIPDLNNNGQVLLAGVRGVPGGLALATFDPSKAWTFDPIALPPGTLFSQVFFSGLDDAGRIVGVHTIAHPSCPAQGPNLERAFIRQPGGGYSFYTDDDQNYVAVRVSAAGQVASSACMNVNCGASNPCGGGIGNYWRGTTGSTGMTLFSVPSGVIFQSMKAINDAGVALLKPPHALWHDGQLFPIPSSITGEVQDINNSGQAIANGPDLTGRLWSDSNGNHAVDAAELTALIAPPGLIIPTKLNDSGVIIGNATPDPSVPFSPHVWVDGQVYKLSDSIAGSPTTVVSAFDINNDGWILASVTNTSGTHIAILVPSPDTDGDGLLDDWEINGIPFTDAFGAEQRYLLDFDGNSGPDCDVNRKDILVEVDAMNGFAPSSAAFIAVKAAFNTAPVSNPNGAASGIKLHIIEDELEIPLGNWTQDDTNGNGTADWPTEFDALKLSALSNPSTLINGYFGTAEDRNFDNSAVSAAARREAKAKAFRYCIFGRSLDTTPTTTGPGGIAEIGGNDFAVTMGTWNTGPTMNEHAGMFMHELGHTLGLRHGGGDDIHYKPNYYSVMNYAYTTRKEWMPPNTWALDPGRGGFSRFAMVTLNENALNECAAQVVPGSALAGTIFIASYVDDGVPHNSSGRYDIRMDWNQNGDPCEDPIADDINRLPIKPGQPVPPASPGETLHGHDDWAAIDLNFLDSPCFAAGVHNTGLGEAGAIDITFEENQALANALPPFCPGDIVNNRSVDVDDLIAVILAWGNCPNGCLADITPLPADGQVDVDDLIAVILAWGACP